MDPAHPVRPRVHNIVGGGDDEWAAVEMTNTSKTVTGMDYNNTFCWVTRWNPQGKIVQVSSIFFFFLPLFSSSFSFSFFPCTLALPRAANLDLTTWGDVSSIGMKRERWS